MVFSRYSTQDPEIFRLGIRRAVKAIKNAIGPKVNRLRRNSFTFNLNCCKTRLTWCSQVKFVVWGKLLVLCMQHVALNWNQVISYFDTMADVVREVPQHVLAQPPHIISSFTQEEKKSMPKVGFNFYWAILILSSNRRLAAANPSLDPCTMRSVKNHLTWIQRQFF